MVRCVARASAAAVISVMVLAAPASAQDAKVLFEQGRAAMKERRLDEACQLLKRAYDAGGSAGPLLNLAACEEARGRLMEAKRLWQKSLGVLRPEDARRSIPEVHLEDLSNRIPRLTVRSNVQNAEVSIDGDDAPLGSAVELDPGAHVVTVRDASGVVREEKVELAAGEKREVVLDATGSAAGGPSTGGVAPPKGDGGGSLSAPGLILLGVGAAGMIGFGVTGGLFLAEKAELDDLCPRGECTSQTDVDSASSLDTLGVANAICLGLGAAGIVAGSILLWRGAAENDVAALYVGPGSIGMRGRF
jgi:tetratricopeptide (TPR) repeat protein